MDLFKVAVIIVNYNGIEDTREAIESVLKQQVKTQIIVVDNASEGYEAEKLEKEYPKIKVIGSKNNLGFAGGNNLGIDYALEKGYEYILLLNNDTVIHKDMIRYLLSEAGENIVSVPAMYFFSDPGILWYGGGSINKWTGNVSHLVLTKKQKCSFATGCCMLIHKNILERVGKMDENYFMYCEDIDYSVRLNQAGIKIQYVPEAKLWHKVGKASGGNESAFSLYYVSRNRFACIKKFRGYFRGTAFPYALLTRIIRMFQLMQKGRKEWRAYYKAIADYYGNHLGKADEVI